MNVQELVIRMIRVGARQRPLSEPAVEKLMDSIREVGLITPIIVWRPGGISPTLIAGLHRLEACKRLGWETMPCIDLYGQDDAVKAEMAEIAENLHRSELTALERAEHIAKWIELSEARAKVAHDAPVSGGRGNEGGLRAAAREIGVERTQAQRAVKIAAIDPQAKAAAAAAGLANSQKTLLEISRLPQDEQQKAVRALAQVHAEKRGRTEPDYLDLRGVADNIATEAYHHDRQVKRAVNAYRKVWKEADQEAREQIVALVDSSPMQRKRIAKLRAEVEAELRAELQKQYEHHFEVMARNHERAQTILASHRGIWTKSEFRKITACLHPDAIQDEERKPRYAEAFHLLRDKEEVVVKPEVPLRASPLPTSVEEMREMAARKKAERAARQAQNKNSEQ